MIVTSTGSVRFFKTGDDVSLQPGETIFFGDIIPLTSPTEVSVQVVSNTSLKIVWQDSSTSKQGFKVYRSTAIDGSFNEIADLSASSVEYTDTGLTFNTAYYYRVESYNSGYTSDYVSISGTTSNTLLAPSGLSATATSNTTIDLSWQDNTVNEDGFKIARSTDGTSYTDITTVGQDVTTYTDTGLTFNTTYYYQVRGYNLSGESNTVNASTTTQNTLAAPSLFTVTSGLETNTTIHLSWQDNSDNEDGFTINGFDLDNSMQSIGSVNLPAGTTSDTWGGLVAYNNYAFEIRATNSSGVSDKDMVYGSTTNDLYDTPTITSASVISYNQVNINWTDTNTNETSFELEYSSDAGSTYSAVPSHSVLNTPQSSATYSHIGLTRDTTYQWRIRAVNPDGESEWSTPAIATTADGLFNVTLDGEGTENGGGSHIVGTTVNITATAPTGYAFSNWTSSDVTLTNASSSSTTFVMPANDVTVTANYIVTDYTVTVNGTNGTHNASVPGGNFNIGETVALTATPDTGYTFSSWTVNSGDVTISNNSFTMPANDVTVTANYTVNSYNVTVKGDGTETGDGVKDYGSTVNITATAPTGYTFSNWTSSDVTLTNASSSSTSFVMPNNAVTITANYTVNSNSVSITGTPDAGGIESGFGNYDAFSTVNISATPATGYTFSDWQVSNGDVTLANAFSSSTTFTMPNGNVSITAVYIPLSYNVTLTGDGTENGGGSKTYGSTVNISATARIGYTFSNWTSSDVTLTNASSSSTSFVMPNNAVTVTANYTAKDYNVTVNGTNGTQIASAPGGNFNIGETVTLSATPNAGYTFSNWTTSSTGVSLVDSNSSSTTFVMPANDVVVTANYTAINYTVTVDGSGGTESASTPDGNFNVGDTVTLSATPDPGYTFSIWTIAIGDQEYFDQTSNTFTMPASNVTATANYTANSYNVTLTGDGTENGGGSKTYGSTVNISATARIGYTFSNWTSSDVTLTNASSSSTSFVMPNNAVTVTANYTVSSYAVTVNGDNGTESGGGNFNIGETVTLSASPDTGYMFSSWTVNSGGVTLQTEYDWAQIGENINGEAEWDQSSKLAFSADGSVVSISSYGNNAGGDRAGHVRVFRNVSGNWVQIGDDIDGPGPYYELGWSLAMSTDGNIVAAGSGNRWGDNASVDAEYVKVYQNVSDNWVQLGSDITGSVSGENFGNTVALSDNGYILAVGAPSSVLRGIGHVRVYQYAGGSWSQIGSSITGEANNDLFGYSVAISADGNIVAIGAYAQYNNAGYVQVYRNVSGSWQKIGSNLEAPHTPNYDEFGKAVALSSDGSILAVSDTFADSSDSHAGNVRIYRNVSGNWVQIGSDITEGENYYDEFGGSISLTSDGNILAIGASSYDPGGGDDKGLTRVYQNISDNWTQIGTDIYGEFASDRAGEYVALSSDGTKLAVGATNNDESANNAGQVRVFGYDTLGSFTMPAQDVSITANYSIPTGYTQTFSNNFVSAYSGTKELEMIYCGPGTFTMGSPFAEAGRQPDETPQHEVTLTKGFYLGKYEVTQAQYQAVMTGNTDSLSATPSNWPNNPDRPVETVSRNDIQKFLTRLNTQQGGNIPGGWAYVLPTEAQWEYACRAGTTTAYSLGGSITSNDANYNNNIGQTTDVGQYSANPWGFFDMHGNVREWTADAYASYATGPQNDPFNAGLSDSDGVIRGGSWYNSGPFQRSAGRANQNPAGRGQGELGFRVALVPLL